MLKGGTGQNNGVIDHYYAWRLCPSGLSHAAGVQARAAARSLYDGARHEISASRNAPSVPRSASHTDGEVRQDERGYYLFTEQIF